jgi:N-acetylglucosamine-6-phosphate deacetylase
MNSICLYNGTVISGYTVSENCSILVEERTITEVFPNQRFKQNYGAEKAGGVKVIDVEGAFIAPGFIDTHIHGYGGFGADDAVYPEIKPVEEVVSSMLEMSRRLVKHGVTAFNPTVYPAPGDILTEAIAKIVSAMGKEDGAQIMGLHLEGPFLSPEKLGVQRPETISPVDIAYMEKLVHASGGRIVNMTLAPEIDGMRELALYCTRNGIILQAGHTGADYEQMLEGMQAGILHATHMFNAMSKLDQRNPNVVGAILTHPEVSCEIIADGIHVHPNLFKLLAQNKPMDKIILVTDSLKPTDQETEPFFANGEEMIFSGGLFRRKTDSVIAGSALTMIKGVQNLVKFGFSPENAVKAASTNPARVMRYAKKGLLATGMDADITVFDKEFNILITMVAGEIKFNGLVN